MSASTAEILRQQMEYYRARAAEYDEWWLRRGRYDHGPELNAQWFIEAGEAQRALDAFRPAGHVLELACGTGIWTERLLGHAEHVTAVDASAEVLEISRDRLHSARVDYRQSDICSWEPSRQFDVVFFSFWLSHVPPERFSEFWSLVRRCLAPRGRVFFLDSRREPTSTAKDHVLPSQEEVMHTRRLNDGREFQIFKIYYEPSALAARLRELGWQFTIEQTPNYFLHGRGGLVAQT